MKTAAEEWLFYRLTAIISFMKQKVVRGIIEMGFIIFLFYANLLMGEYERSGLGTKTKFMRALEDIFTLPNFMIALVASFLGYIVFEQLRKKY